MVTTLHFSTSKGHAIATAFITVGEQTNVFHHVEKVQSILTLFSKTDIKCFNKNFSQNMAQNHISEFYIQTHDMDISFT